MLGDLTFGSACRDCDAYYLLVLVSPINAALIHLAGSKGMSVDITPKTLFSNRSTFKIAQLLYRMERFKNDELAGTRLI
jgi:hypothetical protein